MTEGALKQLSLETLLDLLVKSTSALLEAKQNNEGKEVILDRIKIMQRIKKAIADKRDETVPGFNSNY